MLRHDAAAILFEIKCARQVGMRSRFTWSNTWPYASMVMAPSFFLEQTSHIQIEVAYFLLLACLLNYHGVND